MIRTWRWYRALVPCAPGAGTVLRVYLVRRACCTWVVLRVYLGRASIWRADGLEVKPRRAPN